ncbi:MAG: tetratricopeptide repeat protein [Burkholderiales bacterium]
MEIARDWPGLTRFAEERIRLEPTNYDWTIVAGYAWFRSGDYARATDAFLLTTQRSPEDIDAWNLLGEIQRLSGQPGRAVQTLERAATIDRTSFITYFLLGETYSDTGRLERATAAYQESLRIEPQYAPAWFGLGTVYVRTGSHEELQAVKEQLQKLDPGLAEQLARIQSRNSSVR